MSARCPPEERLRALFEHAGGGDEGLLEHLSECAECRARLAAQQLKASLARPLPGREAVGPPRWRPAVALLAMLSAATLWWWQAPPPERWRAGGERALSALAPDPQPQPRTQPRLLRWSPLPQAHAYRIVCYQAGSAEWLRRALTLPEAVLTARELAVAPATGRCRLDAELVDGGWVTGDEQALVLEP